MEKETGENRPQPEEIRPAEAPLDKAPQTRGFRRRMIAIAIVVAIILAAFVLRLIQFQVVEGPYHAEQAAYSGSGGEAIRSNLTG